jgi:DNA replication and repair protein RecF
MDCWKIKKLHPQNFRNLSSQVFEFGPGINCIFGKNGNGKTNLLEAVFLITNKKSFRKNTGFPQMINIEGGNPQILLSSVFESEGENRAYSMRFTEKLDERYLDNAPVKGNPLNSSIFINPFDSYSFHTSSTFRRQWFDSHFSLLDAEYKKTLARFQRAMKFRNSLLAQGGKSTLPQLRVIDEQIVEYSALITGKRNHMALALNELIGPTFKAIFAEEHQLLLEVDSLFVNWDAKRIFDFYRHQEHTDLKSGVTQVGIHRDDFIFSFDGLNAFEFCSLGQQKMAFLSLIFAYIELFRYKFTSYPIVLIDDVSGELDSQRWKNLIEYLETKKFQVLITTANENFRQELERIPGSRKIFIEHGQLI